MQQLARLRALFAAVLAGGPAGLGALSNPLLRQITPSRSKRRRGRADPRRFGWFPLKPCKGTTEGEPFLHIKRSGGKWFRAKPADLDRWRAALPTGSRIEHIDRYGQCTHRERIEEWL